MENGPFQRLAPTRSQSTTSQEQARSLGSPRLTACRWRAGVMPRSPGAMPALSLHYTARYLPEPPMLHGSALMMRRPDRAARGGRAPDSS